MAERILAPSGSPHLREAGRALGPRPECRGKERSDHERATRSSDDEDPAKALFPCEARLIPPPPRPYRMGIWSRASWRCARAALPKEHLTTETQDVVKWEWR